MTRNYSQDQLRSSADTSFCKSHKRSAIRALNAEGLDRTPSIPSGQISRLSHRERRFNSIQQYLVRRWSHRRHRDARTWRPSRQQRFDDGSALIGTMALIW
jgi:hypothetical protein